MLLNGLVAISYNCKSYTAAFLAVVGIFAIVQCVAFWAYKDKPNERWKVLAIGIVIIFAVAWLDLARHRC